MTASTLAPARSTVTARALVELRDSFPVWFNVWLGLGHVYTSIAFFEPSRLSSLATAVLPLGWAAAYYYGRQQRAALDTTVVTTLWLASPAVALLAWSPILLAWTAADVASVRLGFELLAFAWVATLIWHCWRTRGWLALVVFFVAGALYGFLLENGGITLGFFSEAGFRFYVPGTRTPLFAVAGWCTVFYPSIVIAEALAERMPVRLRGALGLAALTAAIAVSLDLHFDPVATALGMWTWNDRLSGFFLGVPLVNFTSWVTAIFAFAAVYFWVGRRDWTAERRTLAIVLSVPFMPVVAGVLNLLTIGALEGVNGPSWTILREAISRWVF